MGVAVTTENLTILFSDIVGSTELSHLQSPEDADEQRRQHFALLRQALAEAGGSEVKNVGDGLMVVFASASAALGCAVAMQQAVEYNNRERRHPAIGLRIGLSGGEVIPEDDDYWGDPVIEAARLCALCNGGQILAADIVRLTAGRRSRHRYADLGALTLKGLPDPVECIEVLWDAFDDIAPDSTVPLPANFPAPPDFGVIGRELELSKIRDAVKTTASGETQCALLISGEAGQGKTTLVAQAARAAFDSGSCVLFGRCEEDLATPYQLFSQALGHFVVHASEEQLVAHVRTCGSELAPLVPALASRITDLPPSKAADVDSERYLLFAAVIGLLAQVSRHQPVVLVLDDLQWADEASLQLLRYIVAADQPMRLLILGTYRDSELTHTHPLLDALAALRRQSRVSRLELGGLDDSGVVAFMEAIAGYSLDGPAITLAQAVYRDTDGNPFFVSELLRHLSETGFIYQDETGRWVTDHPLDRLTLPNSLREVIGARVGRLGPDAVQALSVAAVIGRDFDLDLLSKASESSPEKLLDILDAASRSALVRELIHPEGRFTFVHALIQQTLYHDLGPTRRAMAHRQVAAALEAICGGRLETRVGELARHWLEAGSPTDLVKAIGYLKQAGDAALLALAPGDALLHYKHALELTNEVMELDPVLSIDLTIGLGTAQRQTGEPAYRETLLHAAGRAADSCDTSRLVRAALANDRGFYSAVGATDAAKVEILEAAAARLSNEGADRALILATLCSELAHGSSLERRQSLAEEAIALAETLGDDSVLVRVLNHIHVALQVPSLLSKSLPRTSEALRLAERLGDPVQLFWAAQWRAEAAVRSGDVGEMLRCIAIHGTMAEQLNQPVFTWGHTFLSAVPAQLAGDTDRAEELAGEALRIGTESGQPDAATIFGAQLIIVSGQRGTMHDLAPLIEQMAAETPDISQWLFRSLLAKAYAEGDRFEDAIALLEEFAKADFDLPQDQIWLTGMVDFADAAIECGDPRYAGPLYDRLKPWAHQLPATGGSVLAPVSYYLGGLATVLGNFDEAEDHLAQSAAFCTRAEAKFFSARTDLSLGKLCAARGAPDDARRARELISRAQATAEAFGYGAVERRAVQALHPL
jgi:class 3 adenylate cyclase/tetratricopeptide (TPR) repeat protein